MKQITQQHQDSDDDIRKSPYYDLVGHALHALLTGGNLEQVERMITPPAPKVNREVAEFQCRRLRLLLKKLDAPPPLYSKSTEMISLTKKAVLVEHFKSCLRRAVGTPVINIIVLKGLVDLMEAICYRRSECGISLALHPYDGEMNQEHAGAFYEKFGMSARQLEEMLTRRWSMRFWLRSSTHERLAQAWDNTYTELERYVPGRISGAK
jgi:hypothetical protein